MSTQEIQVTVGERIRALRNERKWTQQRLAEAASTIQEVVSDVEQGLHVPLLTTLQRFASALGVPISSLLP